MTVSVTTVRKNLRQKNATKKPTAKKFDQSTPAIRKYSSSVLDFSNLVKNFSKSGLKTKSRRRVYPSKLSSAFKRRQGRVRATVKMFTLASFSFVALCTSILIGFVREPVVGQVAGAYENKGYSIKPEPIKLNSPENSSASIDGLVSKQFMVSEDEIHLTTLKKELVVSPEPTVPTPVDPQKLALAKKIDLYMKNNRSYEIYDVAHAVPVSGMHYVEISQKYNVPLKYVIAVARLESRFGTDRYDKQGNLTRPGKYQNIYSLGLTDGGQNLFFNSWEEGVEGFARWYVRLEQNGVGNCRKWKIYNPNGNYCAKVEMVAKDVDRHLNK